MGEQWRGKMTNDIWTTGDIMSQQLADDISTLVIKIAMANDQR